MNARRKIAFRKLSVIVVGWLAVAVLVTVYDHYTLISELSSGPSSDYSLSRSLIFNLAAAFIGASFGGPFLVFYINERLRDRPYGVTLMLVSVFFLFVVGFITLVLGFWYVWDVTGHWPYFVDEATEAYEVFLSNPMHIKNILVWWNITLLTQFILQMDDKFGPGLLWASIRGRYHSPQKEERVFMFLDISDSTAIAEKLGNEGYHQLLRDFFSDMTNSIIGNEGRIYQYVGDEVVISWKLGEAKKQQQCIKCFFDIKSAILEKQDRYMERYGLVPEFKAAIHYGKVTAGEVGIIKRDITFSGDVLNTTARIMSRCNEYGQRLLISSSLDEFIQATASPYSFDPIGEEILRGKTGKVGLVGVQLRDQ